MNNKRSLKVELLRIISILLVISNHSVLSLYYGNPHKYLSLEAMTLMGVTIFFIVTGFYLYENKNTTLKIYKNYLLRVFIPFSIFCFIVIIFEKAITCEQSLIEVIKNINLKYAIKTYLIGIKNWSNGQWPFVLGHTWYVFDYSLIILFFPITNFIVNKLDKRFLYILCIIFLIFIIFIDFTVQNGFRYYSLLKFVPKPVFISLCGHIYFNDIYPYLVNLINKLEMKMKPIKTIMCLVFIAIFVIIFNLIVIIQMHFDDTNLGSHFPYYFRQESFLMLIMSFVFITIVFMMVDILNLISTTNNHLFSRESSSNMILLLSKNTFLVYLIHSELIVITMNSGLFRFFNSDNAIFQIFLNIVYVLVIYLSSILISYILNPKSFMKVNKHE